MEFITEPERKTPIVRKVDVLVLGGGPAGLGAAIAAARMGARTLLVERYGFLGGNATAGLVESIGGAFSRSGDWVVGGVTKEIIERAVKAGAAVERPSIDLGYRRQEAWNSVFIDSELFKYVLDEIVGESNVEVLLHSMAVAPLIDGKKINGVIVENKSGRQAILSQVVVDATGDGDMAARAGAPFEKGRKEDGLTMPMCTSFRVGNAYRKPYDPEEVHRLMEEMRKKGALPLHRTSVGYLGIRDGVISEVAVTMLIGDITDVEDLTRCEIQGRRDAMRLLKFWKQHLPGYEDAYLLAFAPQIGTRESRRILGGYVLTGDDVRRRRKFKDGIALGSWPIDVHNPSGKGSRDDTNEPLHGIYEIPYRCLVPQGIDGLLVAGRCISVTREALGSTRVMATCMAIGEGAGTAAALAANEESKPRVIDTQRLRRTLSEHGTTLA